MNFYQVKIGLPVLCDLLKYSVISVGIRTIVPPKPMNYKILFRNPFVHSVQ